MLRVLGGMLCLCAAAGLAWLVALLPHDPGAVQRIGGAGYLVSTAGTPPPDSARWRATQLPVLQTPDTQTVPRPAWFRMTFALAAKPEALWGILLPYLYGGGQVWFEGELVADIPSTTARAHVRWERPHLVPVPRHLLRAGVNELWVHAVPVDGESTLVFPAPLAGPMAELLPAYDRRMFLVHTVPQLTVAACLAVSAFVLVIWWRVPGELLYGWFGLASFLWGIRTLTFVLESVPMDRWPLWRLVYLSATGGFIVVMVLFASCLAGLRSRWVERGLLAYWLTGPLWFAWHGISSDEPVNRLWTAGLIPIAISTVAIAFLNAWRLRTLGSLLLPSALAFATVCGIHDYLIVWKPEWLARALPDWTGQRYFLLHHGANILLLSMGGLLAARFIRTALSLRELNRTLESRIADRESALAANYQRLAYLERQNAAAEERKLIMREIHDGLGSQLFTSLSRVERGAMDSVQMAASLRACIADMRLALDALAPDVPDLSVTFGDFMFRWQGELEAAGIRCAWDIGIGHADMALPPHATLQILRVAQEALTNVVKHSGARHVDISLRYLDSTLTLAICDDGIGAGAARSPSGRGMRNMRARTAQLGGALAVGEGDGRGTRIVLTLDCPPPAPGA
jgi:signal transduction histidine kinase